MEKFTIDEIYAKKKKIENRKKIRRIIIYILIIPLLIYNLTIIYQLFANSNTTPSFMGYKTFAIVSGSMIPELEIGDIVIIKEVEQSEIKNGDIISFREGDTIVTHRIVEIMQGENLEYKTKGDANNSPDVNPVKFENVEGKFAFRIPKLGNLIIFMQNKIGIVVVAILMYIIYICNKSKEEKILQRKEKREIYERITKV